MSHQRRRLYGPSLSSLKKITSRLLGLAVFAACAIFLLAACSGSSALGDPSAADLEEAYDFELITYQGESVLGGTVLPLSKLRGKPVVLNFWAGLCPPCRAEMADFEAVHQDYVGKVILLGIDIGPFVGLGSREDGRRLLRELGITYPAGTTSDKKVLLEYELIGMPTTVFITSDSKVLRKWSGLLTKMKMAELIEELLQVSQRTLAGG